MDTTTPQGTPSEPALRAPENETTLAALAMPMGESVLHLQVQGTAVYGILNRSRAMTEQSDFFRMQFRGYARSEGPHWELFTGDDASFHNVHNCAWARVDHPSRSVTFGPKGGIAVSDLMRTSGLDIFLFAGVISWAKSVYPDFSVSPGMITLVPAATEDDRRRKSAFFARQGLEFEWKDEAQRSGLYFKDKVSKLIGVCDVDTIVEFGGEAMLQALAKQDEERYQLQQRVATMETQTRSFHAALLKERSTTQVLAGLLILLLLLVVWVVV
ncbi:hypothetical protein [Paludibacterium yongneupense]|uniref:hypothetical protein n=1 Tax=Paludibacterium yongneupense TaxID=400061 RepID=UPI0004017765|nr:hypothetical protein [Paludibacterium yongneupense]